MAKAKAPTSQKNPAWVVTVGAMKGGAGKTMVVDNIAGCLAGRYKVLVVDADPQANASKGLGIDIADPDMTTLADVLTNQGTPPEDAVIRAPELNRYETLARMAVELGPLARGRKGF